MAKQWVLKSVFCDQTGQAWLAALDFFWLTKTSIYINFEQPYTRKIDIRHVLYEKQNMQNWLE